MRVCCGYFQRTSIWPVGRTCPSWQVYLLFVLLTAITQNTTGAIMTIPASSSRHNSPHDIWSGRRMTAAGPTILVTATLSPPPPPTPTSLLNISTLPTSSSTSTPSQLPTVGFWLNQGVPYLKCPTPYEVDRCKNLPTTQRAPGKTGSTATSALWRSDYAELIERLSCTIRKLNCPNNNRSFQLHDIPCQSACLKLVSICQRQSAISGQLPSQLGCYINHPSSSSNAVWPITSGSYLNQVGASQSYLFPYRGNVFSQPAYTRFVGAPFGPTLPRRMGREPYESYTYSRHLSYPTEPIYRRTYEQRPRPRTKRGVPVQRVDYGMANTAYGTAARDMLTEADCYLLPSGGCDKWTTQLIDAEQYSDTSMEQNVRINPGCPPDLPTICDAMFPREYNRQQWVRGKYTVAAVIRIAQTLWWFGPNNQFQPFFRFHVTETLESDIHPYDDKMILTYAWPSRCICPNEITADKTYLMLTHSIKSGQTLNITANTVFLSRVKRYTRRLACWKGSCIRKSERNRRRRYPSARWQWNP